MSKKRNINLFLTDIFESISNINEYTQDMDYEGFIRDQKTKDAVVRNLEVIGEAIKNIPEEVKVRHPKVNWRAAAGMRDKLIHEYFGVNYQIVWETIKNELPQFENQIKNVSTGY